MSAQAALHKIENLLTHKFIAGEQMTIADVHVMFCVIITTELVPQIEIPARLQQWFEDTQQENKVFKQHFISFRHDIGEKLVKDGAPLIQKLKLNSK